jgi:cytosine/uracil/thiamine/allantoin permease
MEDKEIEIGNYEIMYFRHIVKNYSTLILSICDYSAYEGSPVEFEGVENIKQLRDFLNSLNLD